MHHCLSVWVCGTYITSMHHFVGTGLRCAPSTCIVYHRPAVCTRVHKEDLFLFLTRGHAQHFLFFGGSHGTCIKTDTFCPYLAGNKDRQQTLCSAWHPYMVHKSHTNTSILIGWFICLSTLWTTKLHMLASAH